MPTVEPIQRPITLWLGDNYPPAVWLFGDETTPDILSGSSFALKVQWGDDGELLRTSDTGGGLAIDEGARTVTWAYTASDSSGIGRGVPARYELKRQIGQQIQTWVWGPLLVKSGLLRG